jgi:hypothetical protein
LNEEKKMAEKANTAQDDVKMCRWGDTGVFEGSKMDEDDGACAKTLLSMMVGEVETPSLKLLFA